MIFWCQGCGEQHTPPHVTQANITSCAKCGGSRFATWQPVRSAFSQEAVREEALEEAAKECGLCASRQATKHDQKVRDQTRRDLAAAIRALKK